MINGFRVALVIPAYRVVDEIGAVLDRVPSVVDQTIVVDDGSPDGLSEHLKNSAPPRVRLLRHDVNQGVGAATVTGIAYALENGFDVVVKCDGDGQMDPRDIPRLLEPLVAGVADYAKGSRFHHVRELRTMPRARFWGNVSLTFLTKLASGYWHILDPVNGFFAAKAQILQAIPLKKVARRYFFETDLLIRLNIAEARVIDVPLPAQYGSGRTSLSLARTLVGFPPRLISGFFKRMFWRYVFYDVSPVAIFTFLGLALMGFGIAFGGYHWFKHAGTTVATPVGTVIIAALPLIFGFQLLLQAIVLDIQNTPRPDRRETDAVRNERRQLQNNDPFEEQPRETLVD